MKELALRHFDVQVREPQRQRQPGFRIFDFKPKTEEAKEWAKERVFHLFGGSGDCNRTQNPGFEPQKIKRYREADLQKMLRMTAAIRRDPERAIAETEESLRLMEGFLNLMERPSLRTYASSSLYGENMAYEMRSVMETGNNMLGPTLEALESWSGSRFWVSPQITPYAPYVSMVFVRPGFITERYRGLLAHLDSEEGKKDVMLEDFDCDMARLVRLATEIEKCGGPSRNAEL